MFLKMKIYQRVILLGFAWLLFGGMPQQALAAYKQVGVGARHTCALKDNGNVICWGGNDYGQITSPSGVFKQISTGAWHSCALSNEGYVSCWGRNVEGQTTAPTEMLVDISSGGFHNCGLKSSDRSVVCWGAGKTIGSTNNYGQSIEPTGTFSKISAGWTHSCGLKSNGSLACWGDNGSNQVTQTPTGAFDSISAGRSYSCALKTGTIFSGANVTCWGFNGNSVLNPPTDDFIQIVTSFSHSCGLKNDAVGTFLPIDGGSVVCWGYNGNGRLTPPINSIFTKLAAGGGDHTCGLKSDGNIACWGDNSYGQSTLPVETATNTAEYDALMAFFNATGGNNWTKKDGWGDKTKNICSWFGVKCENGSVTEIYFFQDEGNNLVGSIPPQIGNLVNLKVLSLLFNPQLTGVIPPEIGNLKNLVSLDLGSNKLSGSIPPQIGNLTNLVSLNLSHNLLTGSIPSEIGRLSKLQTLHLLHNQFTGTIPSEMWNLTRLERLGIGNSPDFFGNISTTTQITGAIPESIGNLTSLKYLALMANQLTGNIPKSIGNLINLQYIDLSNNQLTGIIPTEITKLVNLGTGSFGTPSLRNNHLCTKDPQVAAFVAQKTNDANWQSKQTNTLCDSGSSGYAINQSTTSIGYDHTKHASPLTLLGELKDNLVTFTVKKTDGSAFSQNGTLYLKVGSFEKYGAVRTSKPVKQGDLQITFDAVNNDNYPNYPKMYFARFESSETAYHAYAGPIIVSKIPDDGTVSTFNGNIASYLDGDKLIFEYVDPENDYKGGLSWYVNDDLTNVKATGKQLVVSAPTLFNANPIYYVTLKSDANEWLYSYPPLKDTYEFASFRNYTFKVAKGKKDKAVVVSVGDTLFEVTANGEFIPFTGQQLNRGHNTDFNLPLGNISSFSNTPITIFEGVENDGYKTPDVPALGLDVKSKQLVDIDRLTDFLNRKPNTRRSNISTSALDNALDELERSNLLPDDFKPSNIRSESVKLALDIMAIHTGMEGVKKFLDKVSSFAGNVGEIANMLISFQELSVKLDQADIEGKPEGIKSLYVLSYLFDETPLKKFLVLHSLIQSITQQIEQLDKVLDKASCSSQVGKVKLSIYEDINWWPDRVMSEIEQVQLLPVQLYYGDYPNIKTTDVLKPLTGKEAADQKATRLAELDQRANYAVTLKQEGEYWTFGSSKPSLAQGVIDFSSSPTYCGTWMVAAKAGNKMYYGRTTLRSDHNEPSKIVVSPNN